MKIAVVLVAIKMLIISFIYLMLLIKIEYSHVSANTVMADYEQIISIQNNVEFKERYCCCICSDCYLK